ncbi:MAG TPA: oxidoreductase [Trebonia sp.]|nr:oxidoreductase [Trebonia sp.]
MTQHQASGRRHWTEADIPDLSGRTALVTGANAGLGLQAARVLAARGAHVILACRDTAKAAAAGAMIAATSAGASTSVVRLDLASQSSVRDAAEQVRDRFPRLDLLINNAGVMEVPAQRTEDGFELTLATNHLGPFALTGLLLGRLAPGARVVTVSSVAHWDGVMDFNDPHAERHYDPARAYAQSKLANLLFTYELDRRLRAAGAEAAALACHPGVVHTGLFATRSRLDNFLLSQAMRPVNFWVVQDARMGALPTLRAATDPSARGGDYFGPHRHGLRSRFYTGYPEAVPSSARSHDESDQARLWRLSQELTGVSYALVLGDASQRGALPPRRPALRAGRGGHRGHSRTGRPRLLAGRGEPPPRCHHGGALPALRRP